ncbi:ABC transporter ATP-binding protein [Haloprofundus halobius]|uniref:ABC transporter ATP-binding protein n=1 Tax=Haloprofundus halobius TaxID=2876194 RepID=UPI001CC90B7F|nr:ABC transporter ATP-binding protein [Haloprofundus halobius]
MSLQIQNLTKRFSEVVAADDVSIEADNNDFLVLLGPSGSGKSTTLRCVAGLEDATEGEILIGGRNVTDLEPAERDIAMVFQNYALYPHMTVRQNMGLSLKVSGISDSEIKRKVEEAARILDIEELLDRSPSELSGGQQQRVALGRSIVRDPSVFLLDEPLSNLDAKLRTQMRTELKQLHEQIGTTFVYVTHDQVEAMTMGTKIMVLDKGEVQQVGTPEELHDDPANEFVAGFIGSPSMNFIDGRLDRDQRTIQFDGFSYELTDELLDAVSGTDATDIRMGIRPEHIDITETGQYHADVRVVEPTGTDILLYLEIGNVELIAEAQRDGTLKDRDELRFDIPDERVHLFSDGEALTSSRSELTEPNP